jgi:P pilus assembly chaperone PapD
MRSLFAALVALMLAPLVADAVLVAPHALFIDDRDRSGEVFLVNASDSPEEVTLEFQFGYPATDSAGEVGLTLIPQPDPSEPSAAAWLRAFPRRVRLEPGQRQRVRVVASPPAGLPDGEYWSRLIVTSRAARPPLAAGGDSAVQAGITFELRTITSVT